MCSRLLECKLCQRWIDGPGDQKFTNQTSLSSYLKKWTFPNVLTFIVGTPLVHGRRVSKNLFQMVNIEYKNVTMKELFWKSINLNTFKFVIFVFNSFFRNVPVLYLLETSFSGDTKWEQGEIEMELKKTPFL